MMRHVVPGIFALCVASIALLFLLGGCSNIPLLAPRPTPVPFSSVAQLVREPAPPGTLVQIDAYYNVYISGDYPQMTPLCH